MKKILPFLILFSICIFPQFNKNHKDLVYTSFKREFNKEIVTKYLNSDKTTDVQAALLAVSHSNDSSFIPILINLDFNKYGDYVSFALGQMGKSEISEEYLVKNIQHPKYSRDVLIALGKSGGEISFNYIKNNYSKYRKNDGLYISLVNYHFNELRLSKSEKENILLSEADIDNKNLASILFCLARVGVDDIDCSKLLPLVNEIKEPETLVALIGVLRRSAFIPESLTQFNDIQNIDWRVRNELVRMYSKISFSNEDQIHNFLNYLNDSNHNISRETATQIRNISISEKIKKYTVELIHKYLSKDLEENTKNELFISLCDIVKQNTLDYINKYNNKISRSSIFVVLQNFEENFNKKFELVNKFNRDLSNSEYLEYTGAMLTLQNKLDDKIFNDALLNIFRSENPPAVFIISTGLDSLFISKHSKEILDKVIPLFKTKLNDPQFSEAFSGLMPLIKKISEEKLLSFAKILSSSNIISTKNIGERILNISETKRIDKELFNKLWENSFKYKYADVHTNKGMFTIKLKPEFAPISVGNFIALSDSGYYDGVIFHRVVPNFVIQTGDPAGTGWGGPDYSICSEFSPLEYYKGAVGMASSGKDTEGSQWYVMHSHFPHLNRRYTNFGIVNENQIEIVNKVLRNDKIEKIELHN